MFIVHMSIAWRNVPILPVPCTVQAYVCYFASIYLHTYVRMHKHEYSTNLKDHSTDPERHVQNVNTCPSSCLVSSFA